MQCTHFTRENTVAKRYTRVKLEEEVEEEIVKERETGVATNCSFV